MKITRLRTPFQGFSIQHLWPLVLCMGIFIFLNLHPIRPQDFWWHMEVGREIVQTGQIPGVDTYSFTRTGAPYPAYQMFWLAEVLFYLIYSLGGPALIVFIHTIVVSSAYLVLLLLAKSISRSWRVAALVVFFAVALGINDWNVRPQAFTFLIGSAFLLAIHQVRVHNRFIWMIALPFGMSLWVNLHGSFAIGLVLIVIWLLDELWLAFKDLYVSGRSIPWRPVAVPLAALAAALLASLANPRGMGIYNYLGTMFTSSEVQKLVPEWAPPTFQTLHGTLFFLGLLFSLLVLALSLRKLTFYQVSTLLCFGSFGLITSRGILWFGIVMVPVLAAQLPVLAARIFEPVGNTRGNSKGFALLNGFFAGFLFLAGFFTLPWFKDHLPMPELKRGLISSETPVEAVRFLLEQGIPGPLFHNINYGSYLIWEAQPDYPVFVDSRIELFPLPIWVDYIQVSNAADDWQAILDKYGVLSMMLSNTEQPALIEAASNSESWGEVYLDSQVVIFVRRDDPDG